MRKKWLTQLLIGLLGCVCIGSAGAKPQQHQKGSNALSSSIGQLVKACHHIQVTKAAYTKQQCKNYTETHVIPALRALLTKGSHPSTTVSQEAKRLSNKVVSTFKHMAKLEAQFPKVNWRHVLKNERSVPMLKDIGRAARLSNSRKTYLRLQKRLEKLDAKIKGLVQHAKLDQHPKLSKQISQAGKTTQAIHAVAQKLRHACHARHDVLNSCLHLRLEKQAKQIEKQSIALAHKMMAALPNKHQLSQLRTEQLALLQASEQALQSAQTLGQLVDDQRLLATILARLPAQAVSDQTATLVNTLCSEPGLKASCGQVLGNYMQVLNTSTTQVMRHAKLLSNVPALQQSSDFRTTVALIQNRANYYRKALITAREAELAWQKAKEEQQHTLAWLFAQEQINLHMAAVQSAFLAGRTSINQLSQLCSMPSLRQACVQEFGPGLMHVTQKQEKLAPIYHRLRLIQKQFGQHVQQGNLSAVLAHVEQLVNTSHILRSDIAEAAQRASTLARGLDEQRNNASGAHRNDIIALIESYTRDTMAAEETARQDVLAMRKAIAHSRACMTTSFSENNTSACTQTMYSLKRTASAETNLLQRISQAAIALRNLELSVLKTPCGSKGVSCNAMSTAQWQRAKSIRDDALRQAQGIAGYKSVVKQRLSLIG